MLIRLIIAALIVAVSSVTYYGGKTALSDAGIKPGSPLYFLDSFLERIDILGAKSKEEKVEKLSALIEEKMSEAGALLEAGDILLAQKAIESGDDYINDALGFLNSLKDELDAPKNNTSKNNSQNIGVSASAEPQITEEKFQELAENLSEAVIKKQEILAENYKDAPKNSKKIIESQIEESKDDVVKIIEELDQEANEKLTVKIEQTQELVDDKIEEAKEIDVKKELKDLSAIEKKYNIWIDHFYTEQKNGKVSVTAHIRRRDPKCSQFKGVFKIYIDDNFYRSFELTANGYDDIRKTFDKFYLEKGEYWLTGVLEREGEEVSNREMKIII